MNIISSADMVLGTDFNLLMPTVKETITKQAEVSTSLFAPTMVLGTDKNLQMPEVKHAAGPGVVPKSIAHVGSKPNIFQRGAAAVAQKTPGALHTVSNAAHHIGAAVPKALGAVVQPVGSAVKGVLSGAADVAGRGAAGIVSTPFEMAGAGIKGGVEQAAATGKRLVINPHGAAITDKLLNNPNPTHWTANQHVAPFLGHATAGTGAMAGMLGGMAYGAINPGEDENGERRGMISGALHKGFTGSVLGAGAGLAAQHFITNPALKDIDTNNALIKSHKNIRPQVRPQVPPTPPQGPVPNDWAIQPSAN
jgi:hypothetical protein